MTKIFKTVLAGLTLLAIVASAQAQVLSVGTLTPFTNKVFAVGSTNANTASARALTEGIDMLPGHIIQFHVLTHMTNANTSTQIVLKFSDSIDRTNSRPLVPSVAQPFAHLQTLTVLESNRNILTFSITNHAQSGIGARKLYLDAYTTTNLHTVFVDKIAYMHLPITSSKND